jgi:L-lactate dehydrogenase complex protein LldG
MDEADFIARFRAAPGTARQPHPGSYVAPEQAASWNDFSTVLTSVGGTALPAVTGRAAFAEALAAAIAFAPGRVVAGTGAATLLAGIPGWEPANGTGKAFADVGLGIVTARMAVSENAAVLIDAAALPERALLVLAQHILVLVPASVLVGGFTAAQADLASRPPQWYTTWVSGPSKTADIEQTLVIGAHGARTLSVLPFAA